MKLSFKVPGFFLLLRLIPSSGLPSESAELFPFLLLVFAPVGPLPIFLSSSLKRQNVLLNYTINDLLTYLYCLVDGGVVVEKE